MHENNRGCSDCFTIVHLQCSIDMARDLDGRADVFRKVSGDRFSITKDGDLERIVDIGEEWFLASLPTAMARE